MKYLAALFILFSLAAFGQEKREIALQTDPADTYVLSYTVGAYRFLFGYNAFMKAMQKHEDVQEAMRLYLENRMAREEIVELNLPGEVIRVDDEDLELKLFVEYRILNLLANSGNMVVFDISRKAYVSNIAISKSFKGSTVGTTYENADSGEIIFTKERIWKISGCPSF